MYEVKKMVFKENMTVGELIAVLSAIPADTQICICGDSNCYVHFEQDGSVINIDNEGLEDCYESEDLQNDT